MVMTNLRAIGGLAFSLAMLAGAVQGWAAEPDPNARAEARERLDHGLYLMENGAYESALGEFEKAQELAPSRLLLYHMALAYVAMDNPVDALETLDEVLAADGTLKSEYVERAKAAKEQQLQRIGELDVKVSVPATGEAESEPAGEAPPPAPQVKAAILVDGERIGETPLAAPLKVAEGDHTIAVVAPGYVPIRQAFSVAGAGRADLVFELKPTEAKLAHVTVQSPLLAAEVRVDNVLVGKTPLADPVAVMPGERVFDLQRPGYMVASRTMKLANGVYSGIAFDPDEDPSDDAPRGRLMIDAGPNVAVTIDGRARGQYREPIELPAGPHTLKLERDGYESLQRMVQIPGGDEAEVKVSLRPMGKTRQAAEARVRSRRKWALTALVGGALLAGGSTGLAVWQNSKLPAAEDKLAIAKADALATCPPNDPDIPPLRQKICDEKIADAQGEIDQHRTFRLLGFIGAGVGAAAVVTGIVLLVTAPDAAALEAEEGAKASLEPVVVAGPGGATFGLRGRF
jgi:hypothetical protein